MELVLGSNFDDELVRGSRELPVRTYFGNFPVGPVGGGRPPHVLPAIDEERFREHVRVVHRAGREFFATLNGNDLALKEYRAGFEREFLREVDRLLDLGVDGFVVALPLLLELLHAAHPEVPISASTFARIRSVTQAEYYQRLGARVIVLEEANRDFDLLKALVRREIPVEILVNQTCLHDCPFRAHHLSTSSLASQPGAPCPAIEYPIVECGWEIVRDPGRLVSGIFVRPEDLEVYEELGVSRFKVSGRNRTTAWLLRAARAYAARSYRGNLLDILSFVQVRAPLGFLRSLEASGHGGSPELGRFREEFARLEDLVLDNSAFPRGFLRRIAATDCEHRSCQECGYCARVARRVVRRTDHHPAGGDGAPLPSSPARILSRIPSTVGGPGRRGAGRPTGSEPRAGADPLPAGGGKPLGGDARGEPEEVGRGGGPKVR